MKKQEEIQAGGDCLQVAASRIFTSVGAACCGINLVDTLVNQRVGQDEILN